MTGIFGRWRHAPLGFAPALFSAGVAWSAPAPPFPDLWRQSADAPRLAEADATIARASGLSEQARARPNPTVGLLTENVAGSSPYRGFDRAETTLQYSQPFELGGKRAARIAAGEAGVAAARAQGLAARIAFAEELARAYAAAEVADRRIGIAEDEVEEAEADLKAAKALVGAGKEARLREVQADGALATAGSDLETARSNRISAYARLSALAGVAEPWTSLAAPLLDRRAPVPPSGATNAVVVAAEAERAVAERRVMVERTRANPDIAGTIGVRRLEGESATAVLAGVSVPLHIFDRNRGNIAAASAELRGAEARAAIARNDAVAEARSAAAGLVAADARVAAAVTAQRIAQETYRLARLAYQGGKAPLAELLTARHGLGAARGVVLDAAVARFDAQATLARLAGTTITGEQVQ